MKFITWAFIAFNAVLTLSGVIVVLNIITIPPDIKAITTVWSIIYYVLLTAAWVGFWLNLKAGKDIFRYGLIMGGIELAISIYDFAGLFFIDTVLAIIFLILVWRNRKVANSM